MLRTDGGGGCSSNRKRKCVYGRKSESWHPKAPSIGMKGHAKVIIWQTRATTQATKGTPGPTVTGHDAAEHSARMANLERGSSAVECRTRNRESPGSNPRCYRFEVWAFSFTSRRLSRPSCINEYLAIDSGGHVSE